MTAARLEATKPLFFDPNRQSFSELGEAHAKGNNLQLDVISCE